MKSANIAILIAGLLGSSACADRVNAPEAREPDIPAELEQRDIVTVARFDIDVDVQGALVPNSDIRISANFRTTVPTDGFEVRLRAPEVEVARLSNWSVAPIPVGQRLPTLATRAVPSNVPVGSVVQETVNLSVPVPGYYRVIASAAASPSSRVLPDVQDEVHQEVWLFVSPEGGRVTNSFDPSLLPAGVLKVPGPLQYVRRQKQSPGAHRPNVADVQTLDYVPTQDDGDGIHEGRVLYFNASIDAYEALPDVHIRVETFDGYEGRYTYTYAHANTDSTGFFSVECPWTGGVEVYDGFVELDDGRVGVDHYTGPYFGLCYDSDVIVGSDAGRVYANMRATVSASRELLERARGWIRVYIGSGTSRYESNYDRIIINPNDVAGPRGVFVAAHEYGHAVHHKALGGNTTSGSCPSPHHFDSPHNLGCALSEGFANWHSAVTRGFAAQYTDLFAANAFYPGVRRYYQDGSPYDGAEIEGVVAAFLYDLTDPANDEPFDLVSYPPSYVAAIVQTCIVQLPFWTRARDIGHMIYCLERAVDPSVTSSGTYFPRGTDPGGQSETATEPVGWDRAAIRRLWLKNLYNETWSGTFGG